MAAEKYHHFMKHRSADRAIAEKVEINGC